MGLVTENAMVTFRWCGGEVNGHTFDDVGMGHVNDSAVVAVTKMAMPGFDVGGLGGIKVGVMRGMVQFGGNDLRVEGGNGIQSLGWGHHAPGNHLPTCLVDDPANIFIKAADTFSIMIKCGNRD